MTASRPRIYLDAAPIIDLVKYEVRLGMADELASHAWHTQQLARTSQDGVVDLYTSSLSIAECTHVKDREKEEQARPFFMGLLASGRGGIKLAQSTMVILELARNLRWVHECSLRGADAVHVATAIRFDCREFLTTDTKVLANADLLLRTHGLRICKPAATALLPDDYRRMPLFPTESGEAEVG